MHAGVFLADAGNIGLVACAVIDTTAAVSYAVKARGGEHGAWWRSPVGRHLLGFMTAFAIVLDQSAVYLIATGQLLVQAPPPGRPDWFAWMRTVSFCLLIPAVLAWRLWLILRPPGGSMTTTRRD